MKWLKRLFFAFVALSIGLAAGIWLALPYINGYQVEGAIVLPGLKRRVIVTRDEKGMAYIRCLPSSPVRQVAVYC